MQLNLYHVIEDLQPQYAAYSAVAARAQSAVPAPGDSVLSVDFGSSLDVDRLLHDLLSDPVIADLNLVSLERHGSIFEFIASSAEQIKMVSKLLLKKFDTEPPGTETPHISNHIVIDDVTPHHATLINRARKGDMIIPGETLLIIEIQPAQTAGLYFNTLEKDNPEIRLIHIDERAGRVLVCGQKADLQKIARAFPGKVNAGFPSGNATK